MSFQDNENLGGGKRILLDARRREGVAGREIDRREREARIDRQTDR